MSQTNRLLPACTMASIDSGYLAPRTMAAAAPTFVQSASWQSAQLSPLSESDIPSQHGGCEDSGWEMGDAVSLPSDDSIPAFHCPVPGPWAPSEFDYFQLACPLIAEEWLNEQIRLSAALPTVPVERWWDTADPRGWEIETNPAIG